MLNPNLRIDHYFSFFFILLLFIISGSLVSSNWFNQDQISVTLIKPTASAQIKPNTATTSAQLRQAISAQAVLVMDPINSQVILSKNHQQPLFPASTTKLMTALVAREYYQTHQVMTAGPEIKTEGTTVGIKPGEVLTVKSLLAAILINSGNDAAMILAEHYPGGYQGFVNQMNLKAEELGLNHTHFTNPVGFDHEQQQTTAQDLAILSLEVMDDPLLKELVSSQQSLITDLTGQFSHQIYNTNLLLQRENGVRGVKTGTTEQAGEVLITWWEWQSHPLLIIVMNSADRYQDTELIMDWIKQAVVWEDLISF